MVERQEQVNFKCDRVAGDGSGPQMRFYIRSCRLFGFRGVHLGEFEKNTRESVRSILLQEVLADINESARSTIVGEFVDKGLSLLNKAFDGG